MATAGSKRRRPQNHAGKQPDRGALRAYRGKRDFRITSEPSGKLARKKGASFFVQKHAASRLHYDFRLEIDGVLKSWAVPKEIPLRAKDKALAVMVEDHPLDYGEFEGTIPEGQYGGGTVMLWDRGTYRVAGAEPEQALAQGKLHLHLHGRKLRGEWALVRMRDEDRQWLLIKAGDSLASSSHGWDASVVSKRKMHEIASSKKALNTTTVTEPLFVEPMKAKPARQLPHGDDWLYELKYDGFRFLALKNGREVKLLSRKNKNLTNRFPSIADMVGMLKCNTAILDGEIVVPDAQGRPSFQLIQNADAKTPVQAFVFDLLEVDAEEWRTRPLTDRRDTLLKLLPKRSKVLHFSPELTGNPDTLIEEIAAQGLEGVIAKRRSSIYEAGRRSGAWVKVKCLREQEFVIGGCTPPKGTREFFGALLLGYYRKHKLVFAGKVGAGFDSRGLRTLYEAMSALRIEQCPFVDLPRPRSSRWDQPLTLAEMRRCTWTKPALVCQVRFTEWTDDGLLRQPAFLGMREDKAPREVVRET